MGSPFISCSSRSQNSWVWRCYTCQNYCQKEVLEHWQDLCLGRRSAQVGRHLSLETWTGRSWARHATREKQSAGTFRCCISHRSPLPRDNKQGQMWGWQQEKQQTGHRQKGEKKAKGVWQETLLNIRKDDLSEDLGPILGKDSSRQDLFNYFTQSEIYFCFKAQTSV